MSPFFARHAVPTAEGRWSAAIERLMADPVRYFGVPEVVIQHVRRIPCRYSTVRQFRVLSPGARLGAYLKEYMPGPEQEAAMLRERVEWEFAQMLRAHDGLPMEHGLGAPRPVAAFPDLMVFVSEEVPGRTLGSLLRRTAAGRGRDAAVLERALERVGAWLRAYQALPVTGPCLDLDEMRAYTELRLTRLRAARHGFSQAEADRLRHGFEAWIARLDASDLNPVQVHGDFNPDNIMIDGTNVSILDFSEGRPGPRHLDLVHLYLHLERLKPRLRFPRGLAGRLEDALLRGYGHPGVIEEPMFRLMTIQQVGSYLTQITEDCPRRARLMPGPYLRFKRAQAFGTLQRLGIVTTPSPFSPAPVPS